MKKSHNKIIIKVRKGGFTKLYANGKWQKGVYNIQFQGVAKNRKLIVILKYDKCKTNKNGMFIVDKATNEILTEHCSAVVQ